MHKESKSTNSKKTPLCILNNLLKSNIFIETDGGNKGEKYF